VPKYDRHSLIAEPLNANARIPSLIAANITKYAIDNFRRDFVRANTIATKILISTLNVTMIVRPIDVSSRIELDIAILLLLRYLNATQALRY
jgi:hypothetical protein